MTEIGIDRVVRNIGTGHFERSLSALMAVRSLVTAGGPMWLPVAT
ncbi:hypothetical protein [Cellulomonas sp.]|nr:hypothetical protein [Cellulomonas sp.]